MSMGGLIMQRCARGDHDNGGDTRTVDIDIDVSIAYSGSVCWQDYMCYSVNRYKPLQTVTNRYKPGTPRTIATRYKQLQTVTNHLLHKPL